MLANPEMVAGRHDRLDTSLMKAAPDRLVSKAGMEALRGVAILPGPRSGTSAATRDRDGRSRSRTAMATTAGHGPRRSRRSARPASLDGGALRDLARYHRPTHLDPHGRVGAETIPEFELAPVGELIG